jgi:hypothetical protein
MRDDRHDELKYNEYHPAADSAFQYVKDNMTPMMIESFASTALEGNRVSELCLGTWERIQSGATISDRYILGLAWTLRVILDD